jgi:hypothetical protein
MAVGGAVIEVLEMTLRAEGDHPMKPVRVNRLWCVDRKTHNEICVFSHWYPPGSGPKVGESIWWQNGWIFYDRDRKKIKKVGVSYRPKGGG